ncbi:hypothetical protein [Flavitalea sp.]|nr:hypothetical protein [Flavitalea sp.]
MKAFPIIILAIQVFLTSCEIMPRNTISDCRGQCKDSNKSKACLEFCDCIHVDGRPLDSCLDVYDKSPVDSLRAR